MSRTGARRLWVLLRNLPYDAAIWREQQEDKPNGQPEVTRTNDPHEIQRFFSEHIAQP